MSSISTLSGLLARHPCRRCARNLSSSDLGVP